MLFAGREVRIRKNYARGLFFCAKLLYKKYLCWFDFSSQFIIFCFSVTLCLRFYKRSSVIFISSYKQSHLWQYCSSFSHLNFQIMLLFCINCFHFFFWEFDDISDDTSGKYLLVVLFKVLSQHTNSGCWSWLFNSIAIVNMISFSWDHNLDSDNYFFTSMLETVKKY